MIFFFKISNSLLLKHWVSSNLLLPLPMLRIGIYPTKVTFLPSYAIVWISHNIITICSFQASGFNWTQQLHEILKRYISCCLLFWYDWFKLKRDYEALFVILSFKKYICICTEHEFLRTIEKFFKKTHIKFRKMNR